MDQEVKAPKAHSEDYFGEYRDYWWNLDFLKLMSVRLSLEEVQTALDVGCGVGHWGQLLALVLPKTAEVTGVDLEEASLEKASIRAKERGLTNRFKYKKGDVMTLPFPDNSFDLVTCQTVLIHLQNPKEGLREMLRVVKPGGLVLAAEPNNFANRTVAHNLTENYSVDKVIERLRFSLTLERGKKALGLGFNSVGDLVPGYLAQLDAENIQVYLSDKAVPYFAPYAKPEQKANVQQMKGWTSKNFLGWDREVMEKYFIAGGGDSKRFNDYWELELKDAQASVKAIDEGTYHSGGGGLFYLVSARKK